MFIKKQRKANKNPKNPHKQRHVLMIDLNIIDDKNRIIEGEELKAIKLTVNRRTLLFWKIIFNHI